MKKKDNQVLILFLIVLFISVYSISMGFLTISKNVSIYNDIKVNPNKQDFKIVFESSDSEDSSVDNLIVPVLYGKGVDASIAKFENDSDPKITGLKVNFTSPNQKAVYNFKIKNVGILKCTL